MQKYKYDSLYRPPNPPRAPRTSAEQSSLQKANSNSAPCNESSFEKMQKWKWVLVFFTNDTMTIRKKINLALLRLVQNEVPSRQRWDTFRDSGWDQVKKTLQTSKVSQDRISDLTFQQTHAPPPWSPWLRNQTTSIFFHGLLRDKVKNWDNYALSYLSLQLIKNKNQKRKEVKRWHVKEDLCKETLLPC